MQLRLKKSLGQHFLTNENVCKDIVEATLHYKPTQVLEVGTGGWVSYSFSGAAHLDPNQWQMTIDDGNKINNWKNNNIINDSLDPCTKQILADLQNCTGTNPLGRILAKFDRSIGQQVGLENFKIEYRIRDLGPGESGVTDSIDYSNNKFSAIIFIDSSKVKNATDLYIANIIIHETVHAYLSFILFKKAQLSNIPNAFANYQNKSIDSIFDEYVDTLSAVENRGLNLLIDIPAAADCEHNYMANKLLVKMAECLEKYAESNNIVGVSKSESWNLAWSGLHYTDTWLKNWSNSPIWPPTSTYNLTTVDSTRGLNYALTVNRLDQIYYRIDDEKKSGFNRLGRKKLNNGCY